MYNYKSNIIPKSGLGDRIGYYLFMATIGELLNEKIITVWDYLKYDDYSNRGTEYPDNITEYIEFPPQIVFVDIDEYNSADIKSVPNKWVYHGFDLVPETQYRILVDDKLIDCTFDHYRTVYTKVSSQLKYLKILPNYKNFGAIHIRRTDFTICNDKNTLDEDLKLIKLIKLIKDKVCNWIIFTDNTKNNYNELQNILSDKLIIINNYSTDSRVKTLEEFFLLMNAKFIVQSVPPNSHSTYPNQFSSFSYIPSIINNLILYTTAIKDNNQRFTKIQEYSKINLKNIKYLFEIEKQKKYFITYGNEKYEKDKIRLKNEAYESNFFDSIELYGPDDLSNEFKIKNENILKEDRGGGYWIWKFDIILNKLNKINDSDILVYLDAGSTINKLGYKRYNEYIELLENSEYGIISFQLSHKEYMWTTKEIFEYFNIDKVAVFPLSVLEKKDKNAINENSILLSLLNDNDKNKNKIINTISIKDNKLKISYTEYESNSSIKESGQFQGGILIMKKNKHLINIFEKCMELLNNNNLLITDYYNKNQVKDFKDNRHDQSITSVIRKIFGSIVLSHETWHENEHKNEYPFWDT
jgi:hypothetical protein